MTRSKTTLPDYDPAYITDITDSLSKNMLLIALDRFSMECETQRPSPYNFSKVIFNGGNLLLDHYLQNKDFSRAKQIWEKQCKNALFAVDDHREIFVTNGNKVTKALLDNDRLNEALNVMSTQKISIEKHEYLIDLQQDARIITANAAMLKESLEPVATAVPG